MIHSATQSSKFTKLVRKLRPMLTGLPVRVETIAIGVLEKLWHTTIVSAPRGDIGRLDDDSIAEAIGWDGDASELVSILVDCGWVDRCCEHRLIIHDWHEHAPRYVKQNINRKGGFVGLAQVKSEVSSDSRLDGDVKSPPSVSSETVSVEISLAHNKTEHNQTKQNETKQKLFCDDLIGPADPEEQKPVSRNRPRKVKPSLHIGVSECVYPRFPIVGVTHEEPNFWDLEQSQIDEWKTAFPCVDIPKEMRLAHAWLKANKNKRKTKNGMNKYLFSWLMRANDKGGSSGFEMKKDREKAIQESHRRDVVTTIEK